MKKLLLFASLMLLGLSALADCIHTRPLRGVNLAGAEFNSSTIPGVPYKNFTFASTSNMDMFLDRGANMFRVPILIQRAQPEAMGELDAKHVAWLTKLAAHAAEHDACLLVDVHNYGSIWGQSIKTLDTTEAVNQMADFWLKLTQEVGHAEYVALGLMSEPKSATRSSWFAAGQGTILDLRVSGVTNLIVFSTGEWSGAHNFFHKPSSDESSATLWDGLVDPLWRTIIEVHQYADQYYSGTKWDCIDGEKLAGFLTKLSDWAAPRGREFFLGEFGVAETDECIASMRHMLDAMQAPEWAGWTYWAAGGWWGNYTLSIHVKNDVESERLKVLKTYWGTAE